MANRNDNEWITERIPYIHEWNGKILQFCSFFARCNMEQIDKDVRRNEQSSICDDANNVSMCVCMFVVAVVVFVVDTNIQMNTKCKIRNACAARMNGCWVTGCRLQGIQCVKYVHKLKFNKDLERDFVITRPKLKISFFMNLIYHLILCCIHCTYTMCYTISFIIWDGIAQTNETYETYRLYNCTSIKHSCIENLP